MGITALTVGDFKNGAKLYVNGCPITSSDSSVSPNHLTVTIVNNNDCHYDAFPGDTAAESAQGYCTTRGSPDIYACAQTATGFVQGFDKATNKFTVDAATGAADDDTIFVNGLGPMRITSGAAGTDIIASYAGEAGDELFESFSGGGDTGMLMFGA